MALQGMTIGQAAMAAGLTRKAVRVYEARGLLPEAERSVSGYRLYTQADVELLTFIRRARTLGLHLEDVREVLKIRRGGTPPCDAVRDLLESRIAEIDSTVDDLLALRQTLADTRRAADDRHCGKPSTVCSIIEDVGTLAQPTAAELPMWRHEQGQTRHGGKRARPCTSGLAYPLHRGRAP